MEGGKEEVSVLLHRDHTGDNRHSRHLNLKGGIEFNNAPILRYFLAHPSPQGNIDQHYPWG